MNKWTREAVSQHINRLKQQDSIDGKKPTTKKKRITSESKGIKHIKAVLSDLKLKYEAEYKFSETRQFRFDFAIPELKIAIEYEGVFSDKSRHTTVHGYSKDAEKYNLASSLGWKVLRYTATNYKNFELDVLRAIFDIIKINAIK